MRSFRIVVVRDAQTVRRAANRRALLTIWDVTNLQVTEGAKAGAIEEGQRFLVSLTLTYNSQKSLTHLSDNKPDAVPTEELDGYPGRVSSVFNNDTTIPNFKD